ncbi:uncharacterized protein LOC123869742 [Maniola jurtina]|uniref:uncharacterized protein LOC123869742 n=1 Tax=Maniola jurtina TaxID=191418 RepID=UPI001E68E3E4|nr:uncharacterized protein LOC123869742 [Maniola jurtina]
MMLVVHVVLFFYALPSQYEARLSYEYPNNTHFQKCVSTIIKKIVNDVRANSILLRKSGTMFRTPNMAYFIAAGNYNDFINNFPDLTEEKYWLPTARFLIMIKDLTTTSLGKIFDLLLKYNVINVLVLNENADPDLYTYNPFENYGCGQRYDRIIEYGKCSMSQENLYPYKLITGLRNCTFKVGSPQWPPYSIDLAKSNGPDGVEQMVLRELGKLEHFQVNFTNSGDGEAFSKIEKGVGSLYMLQKQEIQMMAGGMILTYPRTKEFDYIWGHLAYTDEISYQVKRATDVATWRYTYLEFDALVWTVFILAFLVFLLIFVIFVRPKDKGRIVLKMIGFLFLAGNRIRGNFFTRYLFIHWVLLAYIINVYYVSNLVSFTTNPIRKYQVCEEEDLVKYNLQPCVSPVIKDFMSSVEVNESFIDIQREGCENLYESIETVSKSDELYTVVIHLVEARKLKQSSLV